MRKQSKRSFGKNTKKASAFPRVVIILIVFFSAILISATIYNFTTISTEAKYAKSPRAFCDKNIDGKIDYSAICVNGVVGFTYYDCKTGKSSYKFSCPKDCKRDGSSTCLYVYNNSSLSPSLSPKHIGGFVKTQKSPTPTPKKAPSLTPKPQRPIGKTEISLKEWSVDGMDQSPSTLNGYFQIDYKDKNNKILSNNLIYFYAYLGRDPICSENSLKEITKNIVNVNDFTYYLRGGTMKDGREILSTHDSIDYYTNLLLKTRKINTNDVEFQVYFNGVRQTFSTNSEFKGGVIKNVGNFVIYSSYETIGCVQQASVSN